MIVLFVHLGDGGHLGGRRSRQGGFRGAEVLRRHAEAQVVGFSKQERIEDIVVVVGVGGCRAS